MPSADPPQAGFIDTHCHLANPRLLGQVDDVLRRAREAGVDRIIIATARLEEARQAAQLTAAHEGLCCMAGVHPHDSAEAPPDYLEELARLAENPRLVGIGEIGLDYHYDYSPRPTQREVFTRQLELAGRMGRTVVVHTREAWDDTLAILRDGPVDLARVVLHSFTEGPQAAATAMELGMTISFSGIVTFDNAKALRESALLVSDDHLLTETDAPFLSPEPVRKMKTNEPANVVHIAQFLARLRNQTPEHLAACVRRNAHRMFGIQ